jgi:hypothetical protein
MLHPTESQALLTRAPTTVRITTISVRPAERTARLAAACLTAALRATPQCEPVTLWSNWHLPAGSSRSVACWPLLEPERSGMGSLVVLGQDLADLARPVDDGLAAGPGIGFPAPASTPEVTGIRLAQACQHSSARRSATASAEETGTTAPSRRRAVTAAARATRSVPGSAAPTRVLLNWARISAGSSS